MQRIFCFDIACFSGKNYTFAARYFPKFLARLYYIWAKLCEQLGKNISHLGNILPAIRQSYFIFQKHFALFAQGLAKFEQIIKKSGQN